MDVASGDVLRIKMKAIAEARGEPKLTERPILVLPVSKYFASVYKICQAMVNSSSKPGDAWNVWPRRHRARPKAIPGAAPKATWSAFGP